MRISHLVREIHAFPQMTTLFTSTQPVHWSAPIWPQDGVQDVSVWLIRRRPVHRTASKAESRIIAVSHASKTYNHKTKVRLQATTQLYVMTRSIPNYDSYLVSSQRISLQFSSSRFKMTLNACISRTAEDTSKKKSPQESSHRAL